MGDLAGIEYKRCREKKMSFRHPQLAEWSHFSNHRRVTPSPLASFCLGDTLRWLYVLIRKRVKVKAKLNDLKKNSKIKGQSNYARCEDATLYSLLRTITSPLSIIHFLTVFKSLFSTLQNSQFKLSYIHQLLCHQVLA